MLKGFVVSGVDLSPWVIDWADVEQVKEALLSKATLFAGEMTLTLSNAQGQFSPENPGSLLKGRVLLNVACTVTVDGFPVFNGVLKDVTCDVDKRVAAFVMQNVLSRFADIPVPPHTGQVSDPGAAMLGAISTAGLLAYVDVPSFLSAGAPARVAGASLQVVVGNGSSSSVQTILQKVSDLSSIAVFEQGGVLRARAFRPYQGNQSNLRQLLDDSVTRSFGQRKSDPNSYYNAVTVYWGTTGSQTVMDKVQVGLAGGQRTFPINAKTDQEVSVLDAVSATYFAQVALSRTTPAPRTFEMTVNRDLVGSVPLGGRFPVSCLNLGLDNAPFEIIETHQSLTDEDAQLVLRAL